MGERVAGSVWEMWWQLDPDSQQCLGEIASAASTKHITPACRTALPLHPIDPDVRSL